MANPYIRFGPQMQRGLLGRKSEYVPMPDAWESIGARVEQGWYNTSTMIGMNLLTRPSSENEPKLALHELFEKYPDINWQEPMTERQAEWRADILQRRAHLADTIDRKEDGFLSTAAGLGATLAVSALGSPETYAIPFIGRLSSAAALQAAKRGRFVAGAMEDVAISALVVEPLHAYREAKLDNPYTAMDFLGAVAVSAAASGAINAGAGKIFDHFDFKRRLEQYSGEIPDVLKMQAEGRLDPQFLRRVKQEGALANIRNHWVRARGFDKPITVFEDANNPFRAGVDRDTGNMVVNTARFSRPRHMVDAMDDALDLGPTDVPVKPRVAIGPDGIEPAPNTRWKAPEEPPPPADEPHPHTRYNFNDNPNEIAETQLRELGEEMGDLRDSHPVELSEANLDDTLSESVTIRRGDPESDFEGVETAELPFTARTLKSKDQLKTGQKKPDGTDILYTLSDEQKHVVDDILRIRSWEELMNENAAFVVAHARDPQSRGILAELDEIRGNKDQGPEVANTIHERLKEIGVNDHTLPRMSDGEISRKLKDLVTEKALEGAHQAKLQRRAEDAWAGHLTDKDTAWAEIAGHLDGSFVSGGTYVKHGESLYRDANVMTVRYTNPLVGKSKALGKLKDLENYTADGRRIMEEVSLALGGRKGGISPEALELSRILSETNEAMRIEQNRWGAGIRKLDGYLMRQRHDRSSIVDRPEAWRAMMRRNADWERMGYEKTDEKGINAFLDKFYADIESGFAREDFTMDPATMGGKKGQLYAYQRQVEFLPGKQIEYQDAFGGQNSYRELVSQIELRAKAIAIAKHMGPDTKKTWKRVEGAMDDAGVEAHHRWLIKTHWNHMTGETATVVDQDLASFAQMTRNLNNSYALSGSGVTIALTDPVAQMLNLKVTGLHVGLGAAAREVARSYGPAIRQLRGRGDANAQKLEQLMLPSDINLTATRHALGDSAKARAGGWAETLSNATIKYSGAALFTRVSQLSTLIGVQRRMGTLISKKLELSGDWVAHLARYNIKPDEFYSLGAFVRDGQLSVFDVRPPALKRKLQNLLDESMRMGSLLADPRQTALLHAGTRPGTWSGETLRGVGQYMPTALAVHQKLFARLAAAGGNDARFMELLRAGRLAETLTVMGMMLSSAATIVLLKDTLRNKEPFVFGDKPLDHETMYRILKVSGIAPLITETRDLLNGGMAGQTATQMYSVFESAAEFDGWQAFHEAKRMSPFIATTLGPNPAILDALIGAVSAEYAADLRRRQIAVQEISGQAPIFEY